MFELWWREDSLGDTGDEGRRCRWCYGVTGVVGYRLGLFAGGDGVVDGSWL